ncbi:MAG: membrane protein insertase YidC [Luminiphilus sp.]|nr:membrane protein insertase YidC [Luminiphilus sp.]
MDIQRYLLIAAAAAFSFMLLTEWTAFKEQRVVEQQENTPRIGDSFESGIGSSQGPTANVGDAPEVYGSAADSDDVPTMLPALTTQPNVAPNQNSANSLVVIKNNVLEIVVDLRGGDIIESSLIKYPERIEDPNTPLVLLEQSSERTYIMQSGLVGPDGIDADGRAIYNTRQQSYDATTAAQTVVLTARDTPPNVTVEKHFTVVPNTYTIEISYQIVNNGTEVWQSIPFAQLKRDSSPAPNADTSGFGMQPFLGAATTTPENRYEKFTFADIADNPWKTQQTGGWIAMLQHYFTAALVPNADGTHTYSTRRTRDGFNIAGFTSEPLRIAPGQNGSWSTQFYAGPKDQYALAELAPHLELVVDYGWLWWIGKPLFWLLTQIQAVVINWGVAIILLTLLIKTAFFKLSAASYRSMAKMRKAQPKMVAIKEQHANDKQKQSQAMMELYKKEKINPMGGCLPILVQMPVFIALYWVLMESVELRQAPFALWIKDLAVMDPYFVLPLMMGASMFFMQKLNPPPPDPMQAKLMQWLPVVFTFFFLWFPAGLVLYWVVNNLLSMAQQYYITRQIERDTN